MEEEGLCKVCPTQTHGWAEAMDTHIMQDFIQTFQDNPNFLHCIFLFSKVKTALKEMFHNV
jgi:hypothetical protein